MAPDNAERRAQSTSEESPLLGAQSPSNDDLDGSPPTPEGRITVIIWAVLAGVFVLGLILVFTLPVQDWGDPFPSPESILKSAPVIDGHIDLPILVRGYYAYNVSAFNLNEKMPGHVDIPRLRKGKVGGFFWSVYVDCPKDAGPDFTDPTWRVRDTLEQIDISLLLIKQYHKTFELTFTSQDVKEAVGQGKIASLLGAEGAHQIGNSIAVLRQLYGLGVRYMTLTHMCHNAFADSGGYLEPLPPLHGGLSKFGYRLIDEMNRLGMLVDLSHTSDQTAEQSLKYSKAPVIWSHSSARAIHNVSRNVPDYLLELIKTGKNDAVVMVNFAPQFVAPDGKATLQSVAHHVDHVGNVAGREHVGIGSDFDGIGSVPVGLEDVSKYPALVTELFKRGWSAKDLKGLTGGNFLRVFERAERVAGELQKAGTPPVLDIYDRRTDLPVWKN